MNLNKAYFFSASRKPLLKTWMNVGNIPIGMGIYIIIIENILWNEIRKSFRCQR